MSKFWDELKFNMDIEVKKGVSYYDPDKDKDCSFDDIIIKITSEGERLFDLTYTMLENKKYQGGFSPVLSEIKDYVGKDSSDCSAERNPLDSWTIGSFEIYGGSLFKGGEQLKDALYKTPEGTPGGRMIAFFHDDNLPALKIGVDEGPFRVDELSRFSELESSDFWKPKVQSCFALQEKIGEGMDIIAEKNLDKGNDRENDGPSM